MSSKKLTVGDIGDDVTHLQENLKKHGFNVSTEEEKRKFFGPTTREAVGEFQKVHGIDPSCDVCMATATRLEAQPVATAVAESVSLSPINSFPTTGGVEASATVSNIVPSIASAVQNINLSSLALSTHGTPVRELHAQLVNLGVALPENETTASIFGVGTRDALLQLQAKHNLNTTGVLDDATRNAIAIEVGTLAQPRRIEGRIFLDNGLPGSKVKLRIVNKGFGTEEALLGEVETDERGFYALSYGLDSGSANIEVRALDTSGGEIRLSNPKVNADRSEVINLVAPSVVKSQANEFKLMLDDLMTVKGLNLNTLALTQENAIKQDISLLNQATNWDARLIATAATATKVSAATGIAHDALYGVFRAGLPDDIEALAMVSTEAFATALTRAKDAGVIALDETQMNGTMATFATFKLDTLRKSIVPGTLSSVGDMLTKASIVPNHKLVFEKLVLMHEGDNASLWKEAKAQGISDESISNLQLQGKLAYLTLNNAPLAEVLQTEIVSQENLTQLVDKDLYRKEQWVSRLNTLAGNDAGNLAKMIPSAYSQKELNDRLDAYAEDLASKVRQSFPTHVVNRMLEKDELTLGAQRTEMKTPVQTFLKNAVAIGFQLGSTPVDQFLKKHGETVFAGITEESKPLAEAGAKLLTRVYQMTPDDESMTTLLRLGFTSARQVAIVPKVDFVDRYWGHFGSRKATEKVWDKSEQITSVTFNIYSLGKKIDSTPPIMAISGSPERHREDKDKLNALLKEYPTMESLFGSLDFCECEHCRSVLSPAAYLVDLLRFIDPAEQDWEHTLNDWKNKRNQREYTKPPYNYLKPYDALIQRRPDLPHLPLTCENTNTALPYIDLVNEILEYFVANKQLDSKAAYDTGESTSAELMAEPHNIIPTAYDALKGSYYPFILPFDLWLETVRSFCGYFEMPFSQVLDVFRPSDDPYAPAENPEAYYRSHIFSEYLGLSPAEYAVYTATSWTWADWPKLYGYDKPEDNEASALAKLKSAKTLSRRLGISYKELVEFVQTAFVNPKLNTLVTLRKLGLEVSDIFRYKKYAGYAPFTSEEEAEFDKRLTQLTEKFKLNFDAKQWLNDAWDQQKFEKIILLRDSDGSCNFDETLMMYSGGADLDALNYVKLNLLVRLWKRLGWPLDEIDRALQTFLPANLTIIDATLGNALKTALIYLAHLKELNRLIGKGKNSRIKLLTLWADLPTKGKNSLYAQLFLTRNILKDDAIFDHPLGDYLSKLDEFLKNHLPALQAALNLTADEIAQILLDGNTGDESDVNKAILSLPNVSLLYRYGLLAKALKLSIAELISIKALSGLNPFHFLSPDVLDNIDSDYPLKHTLEFVRSVQQVKTSAFAISDLNYLFRHRFDPFGKYRETSDTKLSWIRTLASELNIIADDYAVPANVDSVNDDALRQKMTLVFPPDVVEMFMGFWLNKTVYSVTKSDVLPNKRLDPNSYGVNGVSVSYDETRQRQQLTHIGVLTSATKTTLLNQIPQPLPANQDAIDARKTFSALLDEIELKSNIQFETFFGKYFDGLLKFGDFFGSGVTTALAEKRLGLLQKILPFLQTKLTRQIILQAMTTQVDGDTALIEMLLTNQDFLALPDATTKPLMSQFEGLGQRGLTATLTPSDVNTLPINKTSDAVEVKASDKYTKGLWRGSIEVPQNGSYRFYAKLGKKDATVKLFFDGMLEPVLNATAAKDDDELSEFIELKSGVLYVLTLEANNLQDGAFELFVKGETTPKDKLSQLVLLPQTTIDQAVYAYTMLSKAVQLVQGLDLNGRDISHILTNPSDFGNVNLRLLPTKEGVETDTNALALFNTFVRLMGFTALKRDMAGGNDDLIAIFEYTRIKKPETAQELCKRIASLTRRKPDSVQAIAVELKMTAAEHFADLSRMERLWQALQVVEKFGVSMLSLKSWLTPQPDASVAMSIRNTIKSRYEQETWQHIAKAIFDPLRQRQRDALVAYIMHIKEDEGLDSVEKLFEYFLIDPGMEPVVQTSRLRLAISSLQTFIQRCFLNLEKQVHPSVLNAQHWSWMKRYRVWEANRKIFLFPENWLEPEWRDDKTHLYQELESSLLQGDVTNQLAEDALYVYLKKLDQLARLEIVTMYAEEQSFGPPTMHVIGRTYLSPHQYFYRRYAHQMWTAWEPVTAEIDGDHIVAVMWRERLHLFWLTFMEKVEESKGGAQTTQTNALGTLPFDKLIAAATETSKGAAKRMLDIQLNWSEYFQGEWTVRESSGFGNAIDLFQPFDAKNVFVTVSKEADQETGADGAVWIHFNGPSVEFFVDPYSGIRVTLYFRVVSKNSRPQLQPQLTTTQPTSPFSSKSKTYNRYAGSGALSITFVQQIVTTDTFTATDAPWETERLADLIYDPGSVPTSGSKKATPPAPQTILSKGGSFTLLPSSNQMKFPNAEFAPLISPVFYADDVYTFFVEPSLTETTVDKWQGYTITRPSQHPWWESYVLDPPPISAVVPSKYLQEAFKRPKNIPQRDPIDSLALHVINPPVDTLTQPGIAVQFGDAFIGSTGLTQEIGNISHVITGVGGAFNLKR
jgi:peptidoglycan hydrolase-like protein with peptidoglycan-binding domain